jgi:hypothetical protein
MPRPHQLSPRVLTRSHEVTRRFLVRLRDAHRNQLTEPQQPRQPLRVATVGLDPVRRRTLDLRWCRHRDAIPAAAQARASPYPVGPAS